MEFRDTSEEEAWRREVRQFVSAELGGDRLARLQDEFGVGWYPRGLAWTKKLAQRGWIAPAWPREYGGAGLSMIFQYVFNEEMALGHAPNVGGLGVISAGPAIISHGSEEQKVEHLSRILRGEAVWCQGFSEPGAGSDLASLQTRAQRDGDDYVVNGEKLWTTGAHEADWMLLLVRTDPHAPRHAGITALLVDMTSPGIAIRPLVDMLGVHHTNQISLENVRVPIRNRLGAEHRGWYVATTTLDFERSGVRKSVANWLAVRDLATLCRDARSSVRAAGLAVLADLYTDATVGRLLSRRIAELQNQGKIPNHEASMSRVFSAELQQRIMTSALRLLGPAGALTDASCRWTPKGGTYGRGYMGATLATIAGGTAEIQRNIIASRGLGLPRG